MSEQLESKSNGMELIMAGSLYAAIQACQIQPDAARQAVAQLVQVTAENAPNTELLFFGKYKDVMSFERLVYDDPAYLVFGAGTSTAMLLDGPDMMQNVQRQKLYDTMVRCRQRVEQSMCSSVKFVERWFDKPTEMYTRMFIEQTIGETLLTKMVPAAIALQYLKEQNLPRAEEVVHAAIAYTRFSPNHPAAGRITWGKFGKVAYETIRTIFVHSDWWVERTILNGDYYKNNLMNLRCKKYYDEAKRLIMTRNSDCARTNMANAQIRRLKQQG